MRYFLGLVPVFLTYLGSATSVSAVCPICTLAAGAGLGLSRYLGIDDSITGIWIGGLILSSGLWTANWIGNKGWGVPYKEIVSVFLFFLFVIPPLYWAGIVGLPGNTLWGMDKVLLGTIIGSVVFILGVWLDKFLRNKNGGKVYVYYQKVIIPVLLLSVASFIFYRITG